MEKYYKEDIEKLDRKRIPKPKINRCENCFYPTELNYTICPNCGYDRIKEEGY